MPKIPKDFQTNRKRAELRIPIQDSYRTDSPVFSTPTPRSETRLYNSTFQHPAIFCNTDPLAPFVEILIQGLVWVVGE